MKQEEVWKREDLMTPWHLAPFQRTFIGELKRLWEARDPHRLNSVHIGRPLLASIWRGLSWLSPLHLLQTRTLWNKLGAASNQPEKQEHFSPLVPPGSLWKIRTCAACHAIISLFDLAPLLCRPLIVDGRPHHCAAWRLNYVKSHHCTDVLVADIQPHWYKETLSKRDFEFNEVWWRLSQPSCSEREKMVSCCRERKGSGSSQTATWETRRPKIAQASFYQPLLCPSKPLAETYLYF